MDTIINLIKGVITKAIDKEIQPTDIEQLHEVFECLKELKPKPKETGVGGSVHVATETNDRFYSSNVDCINSYIDTHLMKTNNQLDLISLKQIWEDIKTSNGDFVSVKILKRDVKKLLISRFPMKTEIHMTDGSHNYHQSNVFIGVKFQNKIPGSN